MKEFWLTKKQSEIFVYLYKYGAKPASTVASAIGWERTNIYKALKKMCGSWVLSEITKRWVKHFFITDKKIFAHQLEQQKNELEKKQDSLSILETELE